jgi:hypothetical protein
VRSLSLLEIQVPNLQLNYARNSSIVLYLHTLKDYKPVVAQILFLEAKNHFNLQQRTGENLLESEEGYYLSTSSNNLNNLLYTTPIDITTLNKINFFSQKLFTRSLESNLNLSKQNK